MNKKAAFSQTMLWQSCIRKGGREEGGRVQWNYKDIDLRPGQRIYFARYVSSEIRHLTIQIVEVT